MKKLLNKIGQRSVARDLTLGLTLTIIVIVLIIGSINYLTVISGTEATLEERSRITADNLAEVLAVPLWNIDTNAIEQIAGAYLQIEDLVTLRISDDSGQIVFETDDSTGQNVITEQRPINFEGRPVGTVELAFSDQSVVAAQQNALITITLLTLFVVLGVVFATQVLLRILLTRPLNQLTDGLNTIAGGNYSYRLPPLEQTDLNAIARQVNVMAEQIEERDSQLLGLIDTLEQQVEARSQRLDMVAHLGERLTAILDVEQLLDELIQLVMRFFEYYHAHVYIIDGNRQHLIVKAGAGDAGAEMKAKGHSIPVDAKTSLVARAARSGEIVRIDNVREAEDWLPNPLLPDTFSEMAVPIMLEDQAAGVLDVQSDKVAGLDESDANLLRSLANHVAVALRNAQLFEQVETALEDARAAQMQYVDQSWSKGKAADSDAEYVYLTPGAANPDETKLQSLRDVVQQADTGNQPVVVQLDEDTDGGTSLIAPITLVDKPIGTVQIHSASGNQQWNKEDIEMAQAVLDQMAQMAENLRLFEETRHRARQEQTIRAITDQMRGATSLDDLVRIAAEELGQRLSAGHTIVKLGADATLNDPIEKGNGHDG